MVNSSTSAVLRPEPVEAPLARGALRPAVAAQRSCIYEGTVVHWRRGEVQHEFSRRVYMLYLDLAELPTILDRGRLWSAHHWALARFDRRDHWGEPDVPLDESIRTLVEQETGRRPSGPIAILTQLRHFGVCFNPLSVYYCHDPSGSRVETLVAEVRNTPWLQMHPYVLPIDTAPEEVARCPSRGDVLHRLSNAKTFHVSPFMEMDYTYRWKVSDPGEKLLISIENWRDEERHFGASLRADRRPLDAATFTRMLLRYPILPAQVIAGIYFEAFRLWRKGARFQSHPKYA